MTAIAAARLLNELVAIPSVSGLSNRPLIQWLQQLFLTLSWQQRILSYRDANGVEKLNLIVSPQVPDEGTITTELAIVCHTDTVPYTDEWRDATKLHERDGMLHGCGACDVKGFLACMLAAALALDTRKLTRPFCFVFTSDEEIGCRGARFLQASGSLKTRYAIIGEPTSLVPARAGKGYCLAGITVHGKAAHSAYPGAGTSAILAASHMIAAIERLSVEIHTDRDEAFSPPYTTLNIGEIRGGTAKNVIPAECSFLLEWRPVPKQRPGFVAEHLQQIARRVERDLGPDIRIDVTVQRMDAGFSTPPESPVIAAVQAESKIEAQTISFGTEAPWFALMGAEAVVIGPGSMQTAHSPRECVPIAELEACTHLLQSAIQHLCS
jgi:acetylornithine deacetylase